jgi:hypothetical protein
MWLGRINSLKCFLELGWYVEISEFYPVKEIKTDN